MSEKIMRTRFRFMIGTGEDKHGVPIPADEQNGMKRAILVALGHVFGGATLFDSMGAWITPERRAIYETGVVATTYAKDPITTVPKDLIRDLLAITRQRAMIVEQVGTDERGAVVLKMSEVFGE